ncbi:hypothetical protein diail_1316 [Diaporthe ilicicola]|nr:hypothetical protein diail_1316 [Diaporthe ilicicola]
MAGTLPHTFRPQTLEEYITSYGEVSQHIHYDYRPQATTKGAVVRPEHRLAPEIIRPWNSFDGEQAVLWNALHQSMSGGSATFPSHDHVLETGHELALVDCEAAVHLCDTDLVHKPVSRILRFIGGNAEINSTLSRAVGIALGTQPLEMGHCFFSTYRNQLNDVIPQIAGSKRKLDSDAIADRRGSDRHEREREVLHLHMSREAVEQHFRAGPTDGFCNFEGDTDTRRILFAYELKAPHKLPWRTLQSAGLANNDRAFDVRQDIWERPEDEAAGGIGDGGGGDNTGNRVSDPISQDEEDDADPLFATAGVITQLYDFMIRERIRYGYISTSDCYIFLRIDLESPTIVEYYTVRRPQADDRLPPLRMLPLVRITLLALLSLARGGSIPTDTATRAMKQGSRWPVIRRAMTETTDAASLTHNVGRESTGDESFRQSTGSNTSGSANDLLVTNRQAGHIITKSPAKRKRDDEDELLEAADGAMDRRRALDGGRMLALLIISHSDDTKFKNNIVQKLQIEWMLHVKDPKQLDVRQGFWKGVNASNLYSLFTREEEREAAVDLLADYSRLFGGSFERAKKDITSFLPKWARGVVRLESSSALSGIKEPDIVQPQHEKASGSKADQDAPAKDPVYPAEEVARLRKYLSPSPEQLAVWEQEPQTLAQWLSDQLASTDGENHMLQSCGIPSVQGVAASQHPENPNFKAALHELYIIVDGEDQEMRPALAGDLQKEASAFLQALPAYRALEDANRRLRHLVQATPGRCPIAIERMEEQLKAQQSMLYHVTTSPRFSAYFYGVIAFETVRTLALLQGVEQLGDQLGLDDGYSKREVLLRPDAAASLQLTGWQLRALLLPGSHCARVLISWQCTVYESKFCGAGTVGLEEYRPMPIRYNEFSQNKKLADTSTETLRKLFGTVKKPQGLPSIPRPPTPEPTALPASVTTPVNDAIPSTPLRGSAAIVMDTSCAPTPGIAPSEGVRQDLNRGLEDLKVCREHSQQELGAIKTDLGVLKGDVGSIKADLGAFNADFRWVKTDFAAVKVDIGSINTRLGGLRDDLAACQTKLSTEQDERRADGESAKADINQVREETVSNTERLKTVGAGLQDIQTSLDTKVRDMFAAIEEVKSILSKAPPRPEDEGYLVRVYPAPDGQNQRDHDSRLYRACLSYMYILWDPFYDDEGGLGLDHNALDQTLKKFPDLDKHVLLNTLENFHRQVFNCPLTRVIEVSELIEEEPHDAAVFLADQP